VNSPRETPSDFPEITQLNDKERAYLQECYMIIDYFIATNPFAAIACMKFPSANQNDLQRKWNAFIDSLHKKKRIISADE
jgi:hypothetical protein